MDDSIHIDSPHLKSLRYGENPHQHGAVYGTELPFSQLSGIELSYNNLLDIEVAVAVANDFSDSHVCCIVKHGTPCGIATSHDGVVPAYQDALMCDPVSAFGSVIFAGPKVTMDLVHAIEKLFVEVIISNYFEETAREWLSTHKPKCRVLLMNPILNYISEPSLRSWMGCYLLQTPDDAGIDSSRWKIASKTHPTEEMMESLRFVWIATKHVKSNAIVLAHGTRTVGIGTGQPNRVDSVAQAVKRAGSLSAGSVLGSDAFFPFPDGIEEAARAGVVAIVQPGGSIRDDAVIETANRLGLVMIFTGERHFRH